MEDLERKKFEQEYGKGPYYPGEEGYLKAPKQWLSKKRKRNILSPEYLQKNPGKNVSRFGVSDFVDNNGRMYQLSKEGQQDYTMATSMKQTALFVKLPRSTRRQKMDKDNVLFPREREILSLYHPLKQELYRVKVHSLWNGRRRTTGVMYVNDLEFVEKVSAPEKYKKWYPVFDKEEEE